MDIKPNPGCSNPLCPRLQAAFQRRYNSEEAVAARSAAAAAAADADAEVATHESNDWGIEVVSDAGPAAASASASAAQQSGLAYGLQYSLPVRLYLVCVCLELCRSEIHCDGQDHLHSPVEVQRYGLTYWEVPAIVLLDKVCSLKGAVTMNYKRSVSAFFNTLKGKHFAACTGGVNGSA